MEKANKLTKIMRATIMTLIVVITLTLGQLHQMSKMFLPIDAFCPFGGLESLFSVFTYGMFLLAHRMGQPHYAGRNDYCILIF